MRVAARHIDALKSPEGSSIPGPATAPSSKTADGVASTSGARDTVCLHGTLRVFCSLPKGASVARNAPWKTRFCSAAPIQPPLKLAKGNASAQFARHRGPEPDHGGERRRDPGPRRIHPAIRAHLINVSVQHDHFAVQTVERAEADIALARQRSARHPTVVSPGEQGINRADLCDRISRRGAAGINRTTTRTTKGEPMISRALEIDRRVSELGSV